MELKNKDVLNYLFSKKIKPNLYGFNFLKDAILLVAENPMYQHQICNMLYPKIAEMEKSTASKVERAIRHALENAKIKETNSHFIALAVIDLTTK